MMSNGEEILNRLNSRSVLESYYRMNADVEGVEIDDLDQNVFARNFPHMLKGGKFAPVIMPNIGMKKARVSMETLNLMRK